MKNIIVIRNAEENDLDRILEIYERARVFMVQEGNPRQWAEKNWPPVSLVKEDIRQQRNYVCLCNNIVVGVFVYLQGIDIEPTYRVIEDGSWICGGEYAVIHRIASSGDVNGVGNAVIEWVWNRCRHIRVDTHGMNRPMQNLLIKNGFQRRGIIHVVEDSDSRVAFEKVQKDIFS